MAHQAPCSSKAVDETSFESVESTDTTPGEGAVPHPVRGEELERSGESIEKRRTGTDP